MISEKIRLRTKIYNSETYITFIIRWQNVMGFRIKFFTLIKKENK